NFLHQDWDMVSSLRRSVAELRAAPKADCSTPSAGPPDSLGRDSIRAPARDTTPAPMPDGV
ncbi:MAG TPA: hypothetical protein VJW73_07160, partial [Gemmatimonadaceae bacterium]|nr:hypothetical protein [Gemmatimonadaceae bacterium]